MKKMSPQNLMNILLPNNVNRDMSYLHIYKKRQQVYTPKMVSVSYNFQLTEYTKKNQTASGTWLGQSTPRFAENPFLSKTGKPC